MTTQPLDNRDILDTAMLYYLQERRRAILNELTALNALLAQMRPQGTKAERERAAYEARQAGR